MKNFLSCIILLAFTVVICSAQSFTDVSGNKRYTGLQNFTQGTTVTTANLSQTGDGDSLIIRCAGDSARVYATNKIALTSPVIQHNGKTILKGVTTQFTCDSATRNALTPAKGMTLYCTNCPSATSADSIGVLQIYTGGAWKKIW